MKEPLRRKVDGRRKDKEFAGWAGDLWVCGGPRRARESRAGARRSLECGAVEGFPSEREVDQVSWAEREAGRPRNLYPVRLPYVLWPLLSKIKAI